MTKERKALEEIYNYIVATGAEEDYKKYYEILKSFIKDTKANKEKPKEIVGTTTVDKALEQFLVDSCPEATKKLKALEIIKKKKVNVWTLLKSKDYAEYNFMEIVVKPKRDLTPEEYKLLKEALKDE